jgi:hypothetical protein
MSWDSAINIVRSHVVKIETQTGYGTGFLAFYNHDRSWCCIATAAHVVSDADEWQQPVRIKSETATVFLKEEERVFFIDKSTDSAVILFKSELKLPEVPIALLPMDQPCGVGVDIGWLGFPNIEPNTLCFFAGSISAPQIVRKAYLIDGVAINGVSGGPVFHRPTPETVQIIGTVSAYHANRATGEALPGLLRAQDVSHFHAIAGRIRSIDEANVKKKEFEEAQKKKPVEAAAVVSPAPSATVPAPAPKVAQKNANDVPPWEEIDPVG